MGGGGCFNGVMAKKKNTLDESVDLVKSAKNVIFHGAPGTGKTYLAKRVAAKIVSDGCCDQYGELEEELQNQIGFIQFYPGYDYSNFVEGYKPSANNSELDFSLVPGIFKMFVSKAREGLEAYERLENLRKEASPDLSQAVVKRLQQCVESNRPFWTYRSTPSSGERNKFHISKLDSSGEDVRVTVASTSVQDGEVNFKLSQLLAGPGDSKNNNFGINEGKNTSNLPSYMRPVWDFLFTPPTFVFIIDEINRGNTSGIFGELFYAIDPGNRGPEGEVTLQYSKEKFYVPDNVLLIGTMNNIDRSVEPFDFAFRRRWNFKEINPKDTSDSILDSLVKDDPKLSENDIEKRMDTLNKVISQEIGEDYQIGAAYFLKLEDLNNDFKHLWDYDLFPLFKEYVHGMDNEKDLLEKFWHAYYGEN